MLSRRDFGLIAGGLSLSVTVPAGAAGFKLSERDVVVATADGNADAYLVSPTRGKHPAVIIWPDIYGLRPAFRDMVRRLAGSGNAVLVVNPFYRSAKAPVIAPDDPRDADTRARIQPMRALLTPEAEARDANAYMGFLDKQPHVDTRRQIGTAGYYMGAPSSCAPLRPYPAG